MFNKQETSYKEIIKECFSKDKDLLEKFHINSGEGLDSCVTRTHDDLINAKVNFHSVYNEDKLIGFFGIETVEGFKALTGFFIDPSFRNKKQEFWSLIKNEIRTPFFCGVYQKNTRAIKFLTSMGGIPALNINNAIIFRME